MSANKTDLEILKGNKKSVKFEVLRKILLKVGYVEQSITGSHHIFSKPAHLPIMIVKPHGGKKHCHPMDVNKVIKMLEAMN